MNPLLSTSPVFTFQVDLARTLWTVLPATLLWGASFPLALAAVASRGEDQGRMVGGIYAANTGGAIVGALAFSLVLIPWIGTQGCERVLIVLSAVSAVFALGQVVKQAKGMAATMGLAAALAVAGWLAANVSEVPGMLIAYGRRIMTSTNLIEDSVYRRGHQFLHRHLRVERRRACSSTSAARWKPPPSPTTCACSACWATFRRCFTRTSRTPC